MAPGVVIVHQATGWLTERKRMFKEGERKPGTFLVIKATKGGVGAAFVSFLAVEDEATMQADALPLNLNISRPTSSGDIRLPDGRNMIFAGGYDAARSLVGAFILANSTQA